MHHLSKEIWLTPKWRSTPGGKYNLFCFHPKMSNTQLIFEYFVALGPPYQPTVCEDVGVFFLGINLLPPNLLHMQGDYFYITNATFYSDIQATFKFIFS